MAEAISITALGFLACTMMLAFYLVQKVKELDAKVSRLLEHHGIGPPPLPDRVKEAAADPTRKIEAIKLYREMTGSGLAEAKEAVEAYQRTLGR